MANPKMRNRIMIRKLEDGSIVVFYDKSTVYLKKGTQHLVFHRWFTPKGFYASNYKPFCELAKRKKHLTMYSLISAGSEHDVSYSMARKIPLPKDSEIEIVFISEKGHWCRKITENYYTKDEKLKILREIGYDKIETED